MSMYLSIILKTIINKHSNHGMYHLILSEEIRYQKMLLLKDVYTMFNI